MEKPRRKIDNKQLRLEKELAKDPEHQNHFAIRDIKESIKRNKKLARINRRKGRIRKLRQQRRGS